MRTLIMTTLIVAVGFLVVSDVTYFHDLRTLKDQKEMAEKNGPNLMDYYACIETMDSSDIRLKILPSDMKAEYHELRREVMDLLAERFKYDPED